MTSSQCGPSPILHSSCFTSSTFEEAIADRLFQLQTGIHSTTRSHNFVNCLPYRFFSVQFANAGSTTFLLPQLTSIVSHVIIGLIKQKVLIRKLYSGRQLEKNLKTFGIKFKSSSNSMKEFVGIQFLESNKTKRFQRFASFITVIKDIT